MKAQAIKQLLPDVMQRSVQAGTPFYALLQVMEKLTEPAEHILSRISLYFNAYTTPAHFLPFLARWVDLERLFNAQQTSYAEETQTIQLIASGRLRELIVAAPKLSSLRGTCSGLILFLETATGCKGFQINENVTTAQNSRQAFHIHISAPHTAKQHHVLIAKIIDQEKPAYVTYTLVFSPQVKENQHGQNS